MAPQVSAEFARRAGSFTSTTRKDGRRRCCCRRQTYVNSSVRCTSSSDIASAQCFLRNQCYGVRILMGALKQCFNGRPVCEGEVTRVGVWEGVREGQLLVCYLTYLPALACRHICVLLPLATLIAWVGNLYLWTRSLFHRFYFADMRRHSWDAEGPDRPDVRGAPRRDLGGI